MLSLVVVLLLLQAAATQAPPRDAARPAAATASIRGRITDLETGRPIVHALVTLASSEPPSSLETVADDDGRYSFSGLAAGEYVVHAGPPALRASHLSAYLGQSGPAATVGRPPRVRLDPGVARDGADLALVRALAIEGRVLDRFGEPMSDVDVSAIDARTGMDKAPSKTDDLGAFRVFGLAPGIYRVCATPNRAVPRPTDEAEREIRTCAPAAATEALADAIVLAREVTGVEIRVQRSATYRISGTIVDSSGAVVDGRISVIKADERGRGAAAQAAAGRFSATGLVPGEYVIHAMVRGPANPGDTTPRPDMEMGILPIRIESGDLDGLTIVTTRAAALGGRVIFEGQAAPSPSTLHMTVYVGSFERARQPYASRPPIGAVGADLRFTLDRLFGPNILGVQNAPDGWIVKTIRYKGADITDVPTVFAPGSDPRALEIVLTNQAAVVAARVVDAGGQPRTDAVVVLFPTDRSKWTGTLSVSSSRRSRMIFFRPVSSVPASTWSPRSARRTPRDCGTWDHADSRCSPGWRPGSRSPVPSGGRST
jgi:Carboxypeptidase regulatory-like domain